MTYSTWPADVQCVVTCAPELAARVRYVWEHFQRAGLWPGLADVHAAETPDADDVVVRVPGSAALMRIRTRSTLPEPRLSAVRWCAPDVPGPPHDVFMIPLGGVHPVADSGTVLLRDDAGEALIGVNDAGAEVGIDVFGAAFAWMSGHWEYLAELEGHTTNGYVARAPLPRASYAVPHLTWLGRLVGAVLARVVGRALPEVQRPVIHLTHDVDALRKAPMLRAKAVAMEAANTARAMVRGDGRRTWEHAVRALRFGRGGGTYWQFDRLANLEASYGVRSTFLVYCRQPVRGPRAWLERAVIDPAYDVGRDTRFQECLRLLQRGGWGIGLHSSIGAATDAARFRDEADTLAQLLESPPVAQRNHWYLFRFGRTWQDCEDAGLSLDYNLGLNDVVGYRMGVAHPVRRWNHAVGVPMDGWSVPTVLMDSTVFDYASATRSEALRTMESAVDTWATVGAEVATTWHQRVFHPDYDWGWLYESLLAAIAPCGWVAPVGQICGSS